MVATPWQDATIVAIADETARAKTFRLKVPNAVSYRAGQHYIVRLTAEDGYSASRSYSIASAPDGTNEFELTVERLEDGEVSTFLHDGLEIGDEIEVRGPIGGWFVWDGAMPAVLVGGGSGIVPLMAMLRLARATGQSDLLRLVVSVRTPSDLFYAKEVAGPETTVVYTRETPPGYARAAGRLTVADISLPAGSPVTGYVCGSSNFAEAATGVLMDAGLPSERIRVERFGPSG